MDTVHFRYYVIIHCFYFVKLSNIWLALYSKNGAVTQQ